MSTETHEAPVTNRRLQFLEKRVARSLEAGASAANARLNYNRQEASALRWAIETITGEAVPG